MSEHLNAIGGGAQALGGSLHVSPEIQISAVTDLSYAMAHCRIPVLDHVTVLNSGKDRSGAVLLVDVVYAEGPLGSPAEVHLDLAADKATVIRSVELRLDPASMLKVTAQVPGQIRVVLKDSLGVELARSVKDVNILAANQWKATPPQLALEMLAAYVQPNSPAVGTLLGDVSDRLAKITGNSSIDGYQSEDPNRVDAIVRATFDAMSARDIRYAEPPANWGLDGQRVRTPSEVLEGRLASCLDATLTMAAVLEQAGINTTIWVLAGHALLGYWRVDSTLESVSTTEAIDPVNQVEMGNMKLVDAKMLTQAAAGATFDDALEVPRQHYLSPDLQHVLGVTDIKQARLSRVLPLPSRAVSSDGQVTLTKYEPGAGPVITPYEAPAGERRPRSSSPLPSRVGSWKNALLDLSLRSRLINFTERAGFRLEVPGAALARLEDEINAGASLTLMPSDDLTGVDQARGVRFGRDLPERERELLLVEKRNAYVDITQASYKGKLRYLASKARTIVEETGSNNLYLAFGMLNWQFNNRDLRSPLVLVPVTLATRNRGERYALTLDEAGASTPNYCLIEKLRASFQLDVPELTNPTEDASGIDLVATFDAVRRAVTAAGLHFRVEESVHLSILQFAKFPLWKDLDKSWEELARNCLVKHLIHTPLERFVDPVADPPDVDLDDLGMALPVPADASQLAAVADAVGGRTFVLEGPPGTGKSQTITNLLAHAMISGRKVLFVAEKRAALDVVKKRLEAVGLGELSLDLHDKSARPAAVREQIREALELRLTYDEDFLQMQQQAVVSSRRSLARYADRLHDRNAADLSLYSARSRALAADKNVIPLQVPTGIVSSGSQEVFGELKRLFQTLPEKTDLAHPGADHPWGFIAAIPEAGLKPTDVHQAAVSFDNALEGLQGAGLPLDQLATVKAPTQLRAWAALAGKPRFPLSGIDSLYTADGSAEINNIEKLVVQAAGAAAEWLKTVTPAAMDRNIPAIHAAAEAADQSGFFGRKKRRRAVLAMLDGVLAVDASTVPLKSLSTLTDQLNSSYAAVAAIRDRVSHLPVLFLKRPWNPIVANDAGALRSGFALLRWLGQTLSADSSGSLTKVFRTFYSQTRKGQFETELNALADAWDRLTSVAGVSIDHQAQWSGADSFIARWCHTRSERRLHTSGSVQSWIDLINHVEPLRALGMFEARAAILNGTVSGDDALLAFEKGTAEASVTERLDASQLGYFDTDAHTKRISSFAASTQRIRHELKRAIPAQLLDARTFDAHNSSGQIGGLRRQLERKRGGMSVRTLMDTYGDLITKILPCTLMSPDSVARFFPVKSRLFDIVVFDEASQIRVSDAIGAMGRASSVVVVGDSKQMPPTSFAEVNANFTEEEEYTTDTVVDEESILTECVHAQVPQQWLSWHYRSQDEALIAFSNIHYYNGKLASFPAPLTDSTDHGISLIRVDGQFLRHGRGKDQRTNPVEADSIVAEIRRRFDMSPDQAPSLGVITFNAQQRDLIDNLLRDAGDDRLLKALDDPDGLFVKNLENVQGDERDTILFSVAFSKNERGQLPLNFGPLSKPGGERRLNVAITRARREVVLYCSFDPAELRAEETSQMGTKHLKAYLEMAHRGVDILTGEGRRQAVIDRHRDEISHALRAEGFRVSTDIGLSDFRIDIQIHHPAEPEQPLVAVLLDGPEWYQRRTVADRDGLPVDVLQNLMKWPAVERVWMPGWLKERDETLARLRQAVEEAQKRLEQSRLETSAEQDPIPEQETSEERAPLSGSAPSEVLGPAVQIQQTSHPAIKPFRAWTPRVCGTTETLDEMGRWGNARSQVRALALEVISHEAPIHRDRLAKLVASGFCLTRVNEDRKRAILQVVPAEYRRQVEPDFYWPTEVDPDSWRIVRVPPSGLSRSVDDVSLTELGNAMIVVAERGGGIGLDELKREALSLFGGRRMTEAIGARLEQAFRQALTKGTLLSDGSGLIIPAR